MAETWNLNLKPEPKSKPTDRARIFVNFSREIPEVPSVPSTGWVYPVAYVVADPNTTFDSISFVNLLPPDVSNYPVIRFAEPEVQPGDGATVLTYQNTWINSYNANIMEFVQVNGLHNADNKINDETLAGYDWGDSWGPLLNNPPSPLPMMHFFNGNTRTGGESDNPPQTNIGELPLAQVQCVATRLGFVSSEGIFNDPVKVQPEMYANISLTKNLGVGNDYPQTIRVRSEAFVIGRRAETLVTNTQTFNLSASGSENTVGNLLPNGVEFSLANTEELEFLVEIDCQLDSDVLFITSMVNFQEVLINSITMPDGTVIDKAYLESLGGGD